MKAITPSLPSPAPTRSERGVDSVAAGEAFGAVIAAALGVAPAPGQQYRPQDSADTARHCVAAVGPARHTADGRSAERADGDHPVRSDGAGDGAGGAAAAATAPDDAAKAGETTTPAAKDANATSVAGTSAAATSPTAGDIPATPATAGTAAGTGAAPAPASTLDAAAAALAKALGVSGTGVSGSGTAGTTTGTAVGPAVGTPGARAVAQQPATVTVANSAVAQGVLPPQLAGVAAAANPIGTAESGVKKAPTPTGFSPAPPAASGDAAHPTPSAATLPITPAKQPVVPTPLPTSAAASATPMAAAVVAGAVSDSAKGSKSGSSKGDGPDTGVAGNTGAASGASLVPGAVTSFDAAMQSAAPLVPPSAAATAQSMPAALVASGVPDQIVQVLAPLRSAKDGDYTLSLQLHPAELGPVTLHVEVHQGVLSVHLVADQAQGHDALHGSLADLRTQLQASGVRTGDIGLGTPGSALSQQGNGQPRHQPYSGQPGYDGADRRPAHHDGGSTFGGRGGDRSRDTNGDTNAANRRQPVGVSADSALDVRI